MSNDDLLRALARGMVAGAVGTIAMTLSERLEMAVTGRGASQVPGEVGAHLLLGQDPDAPSDVQRLNSPVHWVHGIGMGALRGMLDVGGVQGPTATAAHFALFWCGDAMLYRGLGISDVPWRWSSDELASDVLHKGVYAVVSGAVYDTLAGASD
jgi:hypothetical protein